MRSYSHLKKGHFSQNFWNIGKNWDNPGHKFRTLLHLLLDFPFVFINWIDWYSVRNVCIFTQMTWKPVWMYNRVFLREFLCKPNLHIQTMAITAGGPIVSPNYFLVGFLGNIWENEVNMCWKWGRPVWEGRFWNILTCFMKMYWKNTTF